MSGRDEPDDAHMEPDPEFALGPCPTCAGSGVAIPDDAPDWYAEECPTCDGNCVGLAVRVTPFTRNPDEFDKVKEALEHIDETLELLDVKL